MIRIKIGMPGTKRGSNAILVEDGKILLLLRGDGANFKPNHWCPPGGHVEPGETPIQGAVRETREETGLIVKPDDLKPLLQRSKHSFGMIYHFITDKFSGDEVVLNFEHDEYAWVDMEEIDKYETVLEPHEIALIKKAILSF